VGARCSILEVEIYKKGARLQSREGWIFIRCVFMEKEQPSKNRKPRSALRRAFPHFFTELAVGIAILSVAGFSYGLTQTATIGQELDFIFEETSSAPEESQVVSDMPIAEKTAVFELFGQSNPQTTQTIEYQTSQMCFIGDSRMAAIEGVMASDAHFIAQSSMGLDWFNTVAVKSFAPIAEDVKVIIVALGINDIHNIDKYAPALNDFAKKYPDKKFVYVNIGPVDETKYTGIPNSSLEKFNQQVKGELDEQWEVLDQYNYLSITGFESEDGLHYSFNDCAKIYTWLVESVKTRTLEIE